jgi:hypothetical protein
VGLDAFACKKRWRVLHNLLEKQSLMRDEAENFANLTPFNV